MSTRTFDIEDGPTVYGLVESWLNAYSRNGSSTHTFMIRQQSPGRVTLPKTRSRVVITALEHESGSEVARVLVKGTCTVDHTPVRFTGYYDTGSRKGVLHEV